MLPREVLFDTNAMISWMDDREGIATSFPHQIIPVLPFAVVAELYMGVLNSSRVTSNMSALEANLQDLLVVYPDAATNFVFGKVSAKLRRKGRRIEHNDIWIASLSIQHGIPLLSRDSGFQDVEGLELATW